MLKQFVVILTVDPEVSGADLHENLCRVIHEGFCHDDSAIPVPGCISNIQVLDNEIVPADDERQGS